LKDVATFLPFFEGFDVEDASEGPLSLRSIK